MKPILLATVFLVFRCSIVHSADPVANSYEIREHSLTRPYPNVFSTAQSHWHLTGNTIVTDQYVRLTFDTQSKAGGLWNAIPVPYTDWEMHVNFKIHGSSNSLFGDGFAIWYVRDPRSTGPIYGYRDFFYGLGIFVDTYANRNQPEYMTHPYISAMINNGTLHYDADFDGLPTLINGCHAQVRARDTETLIAVRYQDNRLTVLTDLDGTNEWQECFSIDRVFLPINYYFGFSAATGDLTDNHDIISVHLYQLESNKAKRESFPHDGILPSGPEPRLKAEMDAQRKASLWSTVHFVLKIFFGILFSAIVLFAGLFYWKRQQQRRLYFY